MAVTVPVDDLGAGEHACLTFSDEEDRLDIVAAFVADGLDRGQQVVCYTDTDSPAKLQDQLANRDVEIAGALDSGQLQVHTIEQRWLAGGAFSADDAVRALTEQIQAAERGGFVGLRVTSDMSWAVRPLPGVEELGAYETAVNELFAEGRLTSICQYDRQRFDAVTLAVVAQAHPHAVAAATYHDDALLRICRQYRPRGVRVAGEIDYRAVEPFRAALGEAIRLDHDIHVNLAHLRFMDATIGGEILNAAAGLPPGRRIILRCPPHVAKIMTVLQPSPLEQLRMVVVDDQP
jgi:anti-anti-sigma regulatory factor